MHVLIIHQAFASASEAGGTRHYEFARHLIDQGHRVTVVASRVNYLTGADLKDASPASGERDVVIVRPYTYRALHKSFGHRLASYVSFMFSSAFAALRVRGVDVVVGTSPPILQGATAWLVARLKRVPLVFEVRDLWPDFAIELQILRSPLIIGAARRLERFLYRRADRLLVNSPGFIAHVQAVSGRTPALIPNGVDGSLFSPAASGAAFREQWQAADRFVVLYAGAHGTANNLETVLEAARLLHEMPAILFVFVGDGKEKGTLEASARAAGLDNVRFERAQPKEAMPQVVAASDVCLAILKDIPLFRTTYPNKVFDYMAAGKPTLIVIDGVIRQVVEESGGGVFVPPGDARALADALIELAADRAGCAQMGSSAREFVLRRFNRSDQAELFCALLKDCVVEAVV
jgi:glycosyltransferase involved in cell wall biosynthesis